MGAVVEPTYTFTPELVLALIELLIEAKEISHSLRRLLETVLDWIFRCFDVKLDISFIPYVPPNPKFKGW